MKRIIVGGLLGLAVLSQPAMADQRMTGGFLGPTVRVDWNNQIDSGVVAGGVVGVTMVRCNETVPGTLISRRFCSKEYGLGVIGEGHFSNRGNGYATGLFLHGLYLRYSKFTAEKNQRYWTSSERYSFGVQMLFLFLEIGIKKEQREDFMRPSLGIGVGI